VEAAGGRAYQTVAELTEPSASEAAVKTVLERCGRIDGLVNNAGVNDGVGLESGSYEAFMASLHKNVVHYYLLAHYALPALKVSKRGHREYYFQDGRDRAGGDFGLCGGQWRA
jgi:L-fucose dehydrogenase